MKAILLFCVGLCAYVCVNAQPFSLSATMDRQFYCSPSSNMRVYGRVTSPTPNMYKGIRYHFYYYNSFTSNYEEIGWYQIVWSGSTPFQTYWNIQPAYFDGSQITNPVNIPQGANTLWMSIDVNYQAFPNNNTGQQLVIDVEAIDQVNSTTAHSAKIFASVPLLYTNPVTLSSASINSSASTICGSGTAQLTGSPNYADYGFAYDWYRDGSLVLASDHTGILTVNAAGSYYAIVSDACQTMTTNTVIIGSGSAPAAPSVSSSNGTFLCNGATTTLTTSPGAGGTIYWNTGATGNAITVSEAGDYYAWEINSCGQSSNSNTISVTTGAAPAAPVISSNAGTLLCNGSSATLSASGIAGTVVWNTAQVANAITVNTAGTYYATQSNACGTSANSNAIVITTGSAPAAPSISSSNGTLLCNGALTTITASGIDGTITWNNSQTGSSIGVSVAGTYYASQTNSCGTSGNSNPIVITTGNIPSAPSVSSNAFLLCNGSSAILTASNVTGTVSWNTGQSGSSISVSTAGSYYAVQSNSCGTSGNSNTIVISSASTAPAPNVVVSNGTFLCNGASTTLSTSAAGGTIYWNTGQVGTSINVSSAGSYYAYESGACGNSPISNTVVITTGNSPAPPVVSPSNNMLLCNGNTATFNATGSNVLWNNGTTGNTLTTGIAGTYYAVDRNGCGNSSASNAVVIITGQCPTPVPGLAYSICPGTTKTLDAGAGYDSYIWSNGANTQTITVGPGTYSVTVWKEGCSASSPNVTVSYYVVSVPVITASGATTFCDGGAVTLTASGGLSYVWNTGATGSAINVNASGTFIVTATDGNGCQTPSNPVITNVRALPSAGISGSGSVCANGSQPMIALSGSGGAAPYTFTYRINGGAVQTVTTLSGNSVTVPVSTTTPGSYVYSLISVQESSSTACTNAVSGSATVVVNSLPTASISGSVSVCKNSAPPLVSFTGNNGAAPYTFYYSVNGGAAQTISTVSGNSVSLAVPTGEAGSFVYSLISIYDGSNTACSNTAVGSATVVVNPLPAATISGNAAVCQNGAAPSITFTGSNGTAPYTFTYNINGGNNQTVSTASGNSVSVSVPTGVAGSFVYSLIGVRDGSSTTCNNSSSVSVTVIVNPLPSASISGSTAVCHNGAQPSISFTGAGGTAPYTFTYTINGGANQTVTSSSGNSVSIPVVTATVGVFTYRLVGVKDASSTACSNAVNGTAVITVNPLALAAIAGTTSVCQNTGSPVITLTGTNGTAPYTFTYRINNGANQTISTTTGNSVSISAPTDVAGRFEYTLISVSDGSTTACSNAAAGSATIDIYPTPAAAVIATANAHLCNGSSESLRVLNFVAGQQYTWYRNNDSLRRVSTDTIINSRAGAFRVISISDKGCRAAAYSNTLDVTSGFVPQPVITGYARVCEGGRTLLAVRSPSETMPYVMWRWGDPPDGGPIPKILGNDSSFFAYAGQYQVTVMREGCYSSTTITVTADDTVFPAGKIQLDKDSIGYGETVVITADIKNAVMYHWDFGDSSQAVTSVAKVMQNYYVLHDSVLISLDAVSGRNCSAHFTKWLKVSPQKALPKIDGSAGGNLKDWNVFPIPFRDHLKVSVVLERKQEVRIDLFTAEGKWVKSWRKNGDRGENLFTLEGVEELTPGVMYFITAVYNNEKHFDKVFKY